MLKEDLARFFKDVTLSSLYAAGNMAGVPVQIKLIASELIRKCEADLSETKIKHPLH